MSFEQKILYIIATPIGNIKDITLRSLEVLKENVDLVLAEDTRVTGKLLHYYEIKKKMISCHSSKEKKMNFQRLFETYSFIALLTDAGIPCISDPGYSILSYCHSNDITVTVLPGASALTTALAISGIAFKDFYFFGFLPNKKEKRKNILINLLEKEKKTIVFYESPYRLLNLLEMLKSYNSNLLISVCKELTKKFEDVLTTTSKIAFQKYNERQSIKGEYVVIVQNT